MADDEDARLSEASHLPAYWLERGGNAESCARDLRNVLEGRLTGVAALLYGAGQNEPPTAWDTRGGTEGMKPADWIAENRRMGEGITEIGGALGLTGKFGVAEVLERAQEAMLSLRILTKLAERRGDLDAEPDDLDGLRSKLAGRGLLVTDSEARDFCPCSVYPPLHYCACDGPGPEGQNRAWCGEPEWRGTTPSPGTATERAGGADRKALAAAYRRGYEDSARVDADPGDRPAIPDDLADVALAALRPADGGEQGGAAGC